MKLKPGVKVDEVIRSPLASDQEKAKALINEWANKNTHGMIPRVDAGIHGATRLVATTAIALEEKWKCPFSPYRTFDRDFHLSDGTTKKVPMMCQTNYLRYAEGEDWAAVALFYDSEGAPARRAASSASCPRATHAPLPPGSLRKR